MKKTYFYLLLTTLLLSLSKTLSAQITAFDGTSFSFIAKDASGQLIINQNLTLNIVLHANTATGTTLYAENHIVSIPGDGVVSGLIGQGTATVGTFSAIDWQAQDVVLELILNGTSQGVMKFHAVPYAQYAKVADVATSVIEKEIVVVNQANHQTIVVDDNDIVKLSGTINLSGNYLNRLERQNISISGGSLIGTGAQTTEVEIGLSSMTITDVTFKNLTLDISGHSVFINCVFENVELNSSDYEFISCTFIGTLDLGSSAVIASSEINNASFLNNFQLIESSKINNSTFNDRIYRVANNRIDDSILNETWIVVNNMFYDASIKTQFVFTDNNCKRTHLENLPGDLISITGNIFDDPYSTQTEIITINHSTISAAQKVIISANNFFGTSSLSRLIYISGSYTNSGGFYATTQILGNSFTRATQAIAIGSLTGNVRNILTDNITNRITNGLGVTNGGINIVNSNHNF